MTVDEIDVLDGRALDIAVSTALGQPVVGNGTVCFIDGLSVHLESEPDGTFFFTEPLIRNPHHQYDDYDADSEPKLNGVSGRNLVPVPNYSTDDGDAVGLLLGCDNWFYVHNRPNEKPPVCYINLGGDAEADGETFPVAACRAFLKLKRLESDRNVARNCLGATDRGENGLHGPVGV